MKTLYSLNRLSVSGCGLFETKLIFRGPEGPKAVETLNPKQLKQLDADFNKKLNQIGKIQNPHIKKIITQVIAPKNIDRVVNEKVQGGKALIEATKGGPKGYADFREKVLKTVKNTNFKFTKENIINQAYANYGNLILKAARVKPDSSSEDMTVTMGGSASLDKPYRNMATQLKEKNIPGPKIKEIAAKSTELAKNALVTATEFETQNQLTRALTKAIQKNLNA
ncbi:hypothetical protein JW911_01640 [Candidatus Peregrinibacteria bacterium]|nr:hypothetical protein [Candidatus Peregrinibacteria bacterium]